MPAMTAIDFDIGVGFHYATELYKQQDRVRTVAGLMLDERWPRRFKKWHVHTLPQTVEPRRGKLPEPDSLAQVAAALADPATDWVEVGTGGKQFDYIQVEAGTKKDLYRTYSCPFHLSASICIGELPDKGLAVARWVRLAHDLGVAIGARNGIITVGPVTRGFGGPTSHVISDISKPYLPNPKNDLDIIGGGTAGADGQRNVGGKYARYPRWGTYLHPGHVEAIGGRERIQREVQPALMQQIGDLLYIQLTAWIDDAWTPAMWDKRRALRRLMEPILVPP